MSGLGSYERVPRNESAADEAEAEGLMQDASEPATGTSSSSSSSSSSAAASLSASRRASSGASSASAGFSLSTLWTDIVTTLLRGGGGEPDPTPVVLAQQFAASLRHRYGADLPPAELSASSSSASSSSSSAADADAGPGPRWMAAAFQEAIQRADAQCKPLLIYLHSDLHEDAASFVRDGLFSPAVTSLLNSSFVCWGGSMQAKDGYEASNTFQAAGFPFVGVFSSAPGSTPSRPKMQRLWAHEGGLSPENLLSSLQSALAFARETLDGIHAERIARDHDRLLREEQDRSFREAEAADRKKLAEKAAARKAEEERRRAEEEARHKAEEAAELEAAIALSQQLDTESEVTRARKRLEGHPEPPLGTKDVTALRFNMPNGAKLQRRFASSDALAVVRDFVFATSHELGAPLSSPAGFDLNCSFPRKNFAPGPESDGLDMKAAQLHPQAVLFVVERGGG